MKKMMKHNVVRSRERIRKETGRREGNKEKKGREKGEREKGKMDRWGENLIQRKIKFKFYLSGR